MNRPIQTILMRKLSGDFPLTQWKRPQETAMQTLQDHLASLGKRGNTSDLFCIYHQVQEAAESVAVNWPEDPPKSNEKAAELRVQGDEQMGLGEAFRHDEAIRRYNESICYAEMGSEAMALGYAARSKVCLENQEFEFALYNIALARKQPNCPVELQEELTTAETKCREQIAEGKSFANVPFARLPMRLEPNPRIPFLAKKITMKPDPDYGRCLIPDDEFFQPGDVILEEQALVAMNDPKFRLVNCNYCTEMKAFQLIPCPACCSVMYCSEECMEKDAHGGHRFECGIGEKLNYLYTPNAIGPRMFFTGLTLFNDDIVEMRKFCESHKRSGANPLELDYRSVEGLELEKFKNFHQIKFPNYDANRRKQFAFASCLYHQAYLKNPLVQSLFLTEPNRKFMLRYFYDYMQALAYLDVTRWNRAGNSFFPIASICNHSCEPDAILIGGTRSVKLIALKMLDPDEQIFISYGPHWYHDFPNKPHGTRAQLGFDCVCKVCNPFERNFWIQMGTQFGPKAIKHFEIVQMVNADPRAPHAAKLNMMQQFLEKFDVDYPNDEICSTMADYLDGLRKASVEERLMMARREARERADKML